MVIVMNRICNNPDKNGECSGKGSIYKGLAAVDPEGNRTHMNLCPSCNEKRNSRLRTDRAGAMVAQTFSPDNPANVPSNLTRSDSFIAGHQKGGQNPPEQLTLF